MLAGVDVQHHANTPRPAGGAKRTFSRNSKYELSLTGILPAFSPSGSW
jgi:hypothetical protein